MIGPLIQLGFAVAYATGAVYLIKKECSQPEKEYNKNGKRRR